MAMFFSSRSLSCAIGSGSASGDAWLSGLQLASSEVGRVINQSGRYVFRGLGRASVRQTVLRTNLLYAMGCVSNHVGRQTTYKVGILFARRYFLLSSRCTCIAGSLVICRCLHDLSLLLLPLGLSTWRGSRGGRLPRSGVRCQL